ncbi:DUF2089 family protein [Flavobacterium sp. Sd200]|uniref:DUF2089 domain-containing protein n=1 Tax=Flavobacterium sp. Sd200 TaxID=2692211 RepID=UPI001370FC9C|nr:DUF2089 family protein [Flavobacterium sp. Sd200]MXN91559.1 DUF2089 family protein [Flavobacterium sp. Sd200]
MQQYKLPVTCPSCNSGLNVTQLTCPSCSTQVSGVFSLPALVRLPQEEQEFILQFFLTSGSLKEMASQLGISYPTVRNRLDDLIAKLKTIIPQE